MTTARTSTHQHSGTFKQPGNPNEPAFDERRLAVLVATGFAAVVAFQLSLAAGAPWGAAAWGGAEPGRLPSELRVASSFSACFWLFAALTSLSRGGIGAAFIPYSFSRRAMWALTALLAVGAVMNAASSSRWERFGWAPFVLGLTVLSLRLARSGRPQLRTSGKPVW